MGEAKGRRDHGAEKRELCMYMSVCLSSERVSNGKGLCFPKLVVAPLVMPSFPSFLTSLRVDCVLSGEREGRDGTDRARSMR